MHPNHRQGGLASVRLATTLGLSLLLTGAALAQGSASTEPQPAGVNGPTSTKVFHLSNVTTDHEANEITTAVRNLLSAQMRVYLISDTQDLAITGTREQIEAVGSLLASLDRPKKAYRLTYTLAEFQDGKRVGVQHFGTDVLVGQRIVLKQGNKVPLATGTSAGQTQFTYVDVGVNLDSTLDQFQNGLRLRSKVEQSAVGEIVTIAGVNEPQIRQSTMEGTTFLTPGKPTNIGGIDIVASNRHIDIEVVAEPLP